MIIPGVIAGVAAFAVLASRKINRDVEKNKTLFEGLKDVLTTARQAGAAILRGPAEDLSRSPKGSDLIMRMPDLRKRFSDAADKIPANDAQPPAPAVTASGNGPRC
jgi:hypothetical protein